MRFSTAIAGGIAPQNQIAVGDVFVVDGGIALHPCFAAELGAPGVDCVLHLLLDPVAGLVVHWFAAGLNHHERIHEGIIDRALQIVPLAERAVVDGIAQSTNCRPACADELPTNGPTAVDRRWSSCVSIEMCGAWIGSNGQLPGSNASVRAVTLLVVSCTSDFSTFITASTCACSQ